MNHGALVDKRTAANFVQVGGVASSELRPSRASAQEPFTASRAAELRQLVSSGGRAMRRAAEEAWSRAPTTRPEGVPRVALEHIAADDEDAWNADLA